MRTREQSRLKYLRERGLAPDIELYTVDEAIQKCFNNDMEFDKDGRLI